MYFSDMYCTATTTQTKRVYCEQPDLKLGAKFFPAGVVEYPFPRSLKSLPLQGFVVYGVDCSMWKDYKE